MSNPILYETHMHTPLCKHARGEPEDYARVARERGLKGIIVTCHNPIPNGYSANVRMSEGQFDEYVAMVERARKSWAGQIDVRLGLESDYFPGTESWLNELHARASFHYVLGSVHPQVTEYQQRYFYGDWFAFQRVYFEHLAMAAETGLFDCLAHPDLVKNVAPEEWDLDRLVDDICFALDRIGRTGVSMELNTSGLLKVIPEMNPSQPILREMRERNIPVVVGSDAHSPERVADGYEEAFRQLQEAGYDRVGYFLDRKRHEVRIADARASLS